MIFAFFWALTGYHVWVFPNLLKDEIPLQQVFKPWFEVETHKPLLRVAMVAYSPNC